MRGSRGHRWHEAEGLQEAQALRRWGRNAPKSRSQVCDPARVTGMEPGICKHLLDLRHLRGAGQYGKAWWSLGAAQGWASPALQAGAELPTGAQQEGVSLLLH